MDNQNNSSTTLTKEQLMLEYNKKMINKRVYVTLKMGGYFGTVIDVVGSEHFKIKPDKGEEQIVEIFDVRSAD